MTGSTGTTGSSDTTGSSGAARRVAVFGGGRGIGAVVAEAFAARGDAVTVAARTAGEVDGVAARIDGRALHVDVADAADVARAFADAGPFDVVVHAAGVQGGAGAVGPLWETDPVAFEAVTRINFLGAYHVLRAALRGMRAAGDTGSVVLFSGGGAAYARPGFAAYGATKTAVLRLVESTQVELADAGSGCRVFAIAPGAVHTALTEEVLALAEKAGPRELAQARAVADGQGVPPALAAELCTFLATEAAAPLAGRLVHVKEPWRDYVTRDLAVEAGLLRRADYGDS